MKKMNKKGFTIVELVIVIAVIAILAAVLIPTFSGIVEKANNSAALQEATNAYKEAFALAIADDGVINTDDNAGGENVVNGFTFTWTDEETASVQAKEGFGYTVSLADGKLTVTKCTSHTAVGNTGKCTCGTTVPAGE